MGPHSDNGDLRDFGGGNSILAGAGDAPKVMQTG